jgi:peptidoglycan/LPS O-acetylase OafA/YrhL
LPRSRSRRADPPFAPAGIVRSRALYQALSGLLSFEARRHAALKRGPARLGTILLIILILLLVGALPSWPYSSGWGYYPSGTLGIVLIVVLILLLMGRI